MTRLERWAHEAKRKTDAGSIFMWDNEIYPDPQWLIDDEGIQMTSGRITLCFGDKREYGVLAEIKKRARFLVEAK